MATTGLRRGELAGLRRTDIDWDHARVNPSTPRVVVDGHAQESEAKTRSGERWVALDPRTLAALKEYVTTWSMERDLLGQDTPLLFVWPGGRPLHPDTITDLFRTLRRGWSSAHPTSRTRHSYATAALKAGVSPKMISERLGHSSAAFTLQTYTHVIPGMDELAASTVADLILRPFFDLDGHENGHEDAEEASTEDKRPADPAHFRRSAGFSFRSGGSVLVQDIGNPSLKT
jgi:integrase